MELWEIRYSGHYINIRRFSFSRNYVTMELLHNSVDTINVSLKVSKSANKGQYERYEMREMTKFAWISSVRALRSVT